jgi:Zn ribbon nucleic-acid-binding protein
MKLKIAGSEKYDIICPQCGIKNKLSLNLHDDLDMIYFCDSLKCPQCEAYIKLSISVEYTLKVK